jgi:type III pantothenate kinase
MKALLLDVGNSRIKWGIGEDGEVHRTGQITHERIRERGLGALTTRLPHDVDAVIASNVAGPSFATRLAGVVGAHLGRELHFAKSGRAACGVTNAYTHPRRMGVDRWVAMVGAWTELGQACLVVDAGTAVTIDAIDDDGRHLGGQILPGTALMAVSLAVDTSELPKVPPLKAADFAGLDMFAHSTRRAIQSGVLGAVVGAIERASGALATASTDAVLVLTGGDAPRLLPALDPGVIHRPNLVLQGLLRLLEAGQS